MPEAPTSPGPEADPGSVKEDTVSDARRRQPSLSVQSKMRSSSFRKSSVSYGSSSPNPLATIKSPPLPPLTPDGDSVQEVYRKQASRIEELEKENKKLEKDLEEANGRWKKTEEQLEDLREASVDVEELKDKLNKAEEKASEIDKLVSGYATSVIVMILRPFATDRLTGSHYRKPRFPRYSARIRISTRHTNPQPA